MCKHGTDKFIQIKDWRRGGIVRSIAVDACIADEVKTLNDAGVQTVGSCCGNNQNNQYPHVLTLKESAHIIEKLGYTHTDYEGVLLEVKLQNPHEKNKKKR